MHKDLLKQNFENIINHGFTAGYSCGLHIHFNKDYYGDKCDECTEKILTIIDMFWKQLVFFSRRRYSRIERWSNKYDKTPEEIVSDMKYDHKRITFTTKEPYENEKTKEIRKTGCFNGQNLMYMLATINEKIRSGEVEYGFNTDDVNIPFMESINSSKFKTSFAFVLLISLPAP